MTFLDVSQPPDSIILVKERSSVRMTAVCSDMWAEDGVEVACFPKQDGFAVYLTSPDTPVVRLRLHWRKQPPVGTRYLGDHWERGYGDLEWRSMVPERIMPWYFLANNKEGTYGCGVKTGSGALCYWTVDSSGISLWLDVRCGASAVELGPRQLHAAQVVSRCFEPDISVFRAAQEFCSSLCDAPLLPKTPVYGGNNWYYAYGSASHDEIIGDSRLIAELAPATGARPFMVIDDGWQTKDQHSDTGLWWEDKMKFPSMRSLAQEMKEIGVRPGIWARPLLAAASAPSDLILHHYPSDNWNGSSVLDPTHPDVLNIIREDCKRLASWGYDLLKFDFSTYDIMRKWGFEMGYSLTQDGWRFHDRSKTTAEAVRGLYNAIREAAGDMLLLGCNTIGHLAAGIVEIQRTGDDTSGKRWERTRKMGLNTLAFRMPQHDALFAVDADCVGITQEVPWSLNRQWLELLSASGTPLFVSAAANAINLQVKKALKEAFAIASMPQPAAEPLDWMDNTCPATWRFGDVERTFEWSNPCSGDLSL